MPDVDVSVAKPRPKYLNLAAIRLPLPALVSILHRVSGALLFAVGIPSILWFVQRSLASADGYDAVMRPLASPLGKLAVLILAWSYLYHLLAGLRHLALDLHVGIDLESARMSSAVVLVLSALLALVVAVRVW